MYHTLECTTMRKFGLNKSGYWTDLKKTDKSPHTLHSILHTLHTLHVDFVTFSHVECKLATRTRKHCRQSSSHIFDMLFFCGGEEGGGPESVPNSFYSFFIFSLQIIPPPPSPFPIFQFPLFRVAPPFPLVYPLFKNLHSAPLSHSFTPFLKISIQSPPPFSLWPKFSTPTFKKGGEGADCGSQ